MRASAPTRELVALLALFVTLAAAMSTQAAAQPRFAAFHRHFAVIDTVALSDDALVGNVHDVAVRKGGSILVVDDRDAFLFDQNGGLIATLEAEACHPGANWHPSNAHPLPDGSILVQNGGAPFGMVFDGDGRCLDGVGEHFRPSGSLCASKAGWYQLTRYEAPGVGGVTPFSLALYDPQTDHSRKIADIDNSFNHINMRSDSRGLVCLEDGRVVMTQAANPELQVFAPDGELLDRLFQPPKYFSAITEDIPYSPNLIDIVKGFRVIDKERTVVYRMGDLGSGRVLVQYMDGKEGIAVQVYDLEERRALHDESLFNPHPIMTATPDGVAYGLLVRGTDNQGEALNPSLIRYRFVADD